METETLRDSDSPLIDILSEDARASVDGIDFSQLDGRRLVVTGASGLLGVQVLSSLERICSAMRIRPQVSLVVKSQPDPVFAHFAEKIGAQVLRGDLSEQSFCASLPEFDVVLHLAGYGQPAHFMSDPVRTLKLNTMATLALIEKLAPNGKFLFASSAEVYTGLEKPPFDESQVGTTNTTHPRFSYIEGKRGGEAICNAFRARGVEAKSARIALTYGPGTRKGDTRVLNSLIEKALKGRLELMDHGEAVRTFLYVTDAVNMMWRVLLSGKQPIYNIGGKSRVSILGLAEKIGDLLGVPVHLPSAAPKSVAGAPTVVELNMSRVESELGFSTYVPLDSGLKRTLEFQKHLYAGPQ